MASSFGSLTPHLYLAPSLVRTTDLQLTIFNIVSIWCMLYMVTAQASSTETRAQCLFSAATHPPMQALKLHC